MPELKNARHERFAQNLVNGLASTEAYRQAGYKNSPASATRLSKKVNVAARVKELKVEAAEANQVTRGEIIGNLRDIYEQSMKPQEVYGAEGQLLHERRDLTNANKATHLLGQTIGVYQSEDKTQVNINTEQAKIYTYPDNGKGPKQ